MIITDKFILLNMPKTGSSFVRSCLKDVHHRQVSSLSRAEKILYRARIRRKPFFKEIMVKRLGMALPDQHGGYSDIPSRYRNRKIISVIRNPQDLLLSHYTYEWWKENSVLEKSALEKHFPNFPDLTLKEYIDYKNFKLEKTFGKNPKKDFKAFLHRHGFQGKP